MLVLSWPGLLAFVVIALTGVAIRAVPQAVGIALVITPLVAAAAGQDMAIVAGLGGVAALIAIKRMLGNDAAALFRADGAGVLFNRLLYDRDTRERANWVRGSRVS
jgi:hypothetical protein